MIEHALMLRAPRSDDRVVIDGAPRFTRIIEIPARHGPVVTARLAVTAEGLVEPAIDGVGVGRDVLSPGWTSYPWRLRVATHDVTAMIVAGARHELRLTAGRGWYCGRLGWWGAERLYGDEPGVAAALEITFADGSTLGVVTDATWDVTASAIVRDDLYDGQTIDLTRDGGRSHPPDTERIDATRLVPRIGPPIVRHEVISPAEMSTDGSDAVIVDFGQNLVGWTRLRVQGPRGHVLRIRHAEVLEHGTLATRPLRSARAEDIVTLSGGEDVIEPTFTFHGFRYARIEGWDAVEGSVEAVVVGSDLERTGRFSCGDALLDRFHRNVVWSLRGNTVGLPTDCPQRDERLGWTGDIAVFAPTACFLFDMSAFLRDWLADLRAEQRAAQGRVPYVVPDVLRSWTVDPGAEPESAAIWSDAAVWVPWAIWEAYGDVAVLEESYESMTAHVERVCGRLSARGVWEGDFQFGDWLDPTAPPDDPFAAVADRDVIATAALYRSVAIVAQTARVLGRAEDARDAELRADRLRRDFARVYATANGRLRSDAPAVYALAIVSGVLTADAARAAGRRLAELVRTAGHRVNAGFAGAPYLCDALTRTGHLDDAHALMLNVNSPSWLAPVAQGATTIWERWDSLLPDGSVNPGEMTSFNHYALGAVADWMHRVIGGLVPAAPGWARVRIDPRPPAGLPWASTSIDSPRGRIALSWWRDGEGALRAEYEAPDGVEVDIAPAMAGRVKRVDVVTRAAPHRVDG